MHVAPTVMSADDGGGEGGATAWLNTASTSAWALYVAGVKGEGWTRGGCLVSIGG